MNESTKRYYRKKFSRITCSLLDKFIKEQHLQERDFMLNAPGINISLLSGSEDEIEIPEDLRKSLKKYQCSDREPQVAILSLVNCSSRVRFNDL